MSVTDRFAYSSFKCRCGARLAFDTAGELGGVPTSGMPAPNGWQCEAVLLGADLPQATSDAGEGVVPVDDQVHFPGLQFNPIDGGETIDTILPIVEHPREPAPEYAGFRDRVEGGDVIAAALGAMAHTGDTEASAEVRLG